MELETFYAIPVDAISDSDSIRCVRLEDYRLLQRVAADLLTYIDEHDWGTIPEGATADRLRAMVHTHAVEKMARFPDCPGCDAEVDGPVQDSASTNEVPK